MLRKTVSQCIVFPGNGFSFFPHHGTDQRDEDIKSKLPMSPYHACMLRRRMQHALCLTQDYRPVHLLLIWSQNPPSLNKMSPNTDFDSIFFNVIATHIFSKNSNFESDSKADEQDLYLSTKKAIEKDGSIFFLF